MNTYRVFCDLWEEIETLIEFGGDYWKTYIACLCLCFPGNWEREGMLKIWTDPQTLKSLVMMNLLFIIFFCVSASSVYFSDKVVYENPSEFLNNIRYLKARQELMNDAYAVQTTAYAIMAHMNNNKAQKYETEQIVRWLNLMRNSIGGFAATQVLLSLLFKIN